MLGGLALRLAFDYDQKRLCLDWGSEGTAFEPLKISGGTITITGVPNYQDQLWTLTLNESLFPFVSRATVYSPILAAVVSKARITIKIYGVGESQQEGTNLIASHFASQSIFPSYFPYVALPLAEESSVAASLRARQPSDVCFYFPRTRQRLWSNEDTLRAASPYFATLLSSEFAESSTSSSTPESVLDAFVPPYTYDDSDAETDNIHYLNPKVDNEGKTATDDFSFKSFPFKTIKITDTTYSTYLAVLLWITTHHISFAPLRSTFHGIFSFGATPASYRAAAVSQLKTQQNPSLPAPASPKSVYRLAHLLELSDLSTLALSNFQEQLNPAGAVLELYGGTSCAYPEIQAVALEYVVENWGTVKGSVGMKMVEQKIERGDTSGEMALIGIKLAKKLMERYHK